MMKNDVELTIPFLIIKGQGQNAGGVYLADILNVIFDRSVLIGENSQFDIEKIRSTTKLAIIENLRDKNFTEYGNIIEAYGSDNTTMLESLGNPNDDGGVLKLSVPNIYNGFLLHDFIHDPERLLELTVGRLSSLCKALYPDAPIYVKQISANALDDHITNYVTSTPPNLNIYSGFVPSMKARNIPTNSVWWINDANENVFVAYLGDDTNNCILLYPKSM